MTNDLPAGFTVGALTFGATSGNIMLNGNALTLMGSITFPGGGSPHLICNVPLKIGAPLQLGNRILNLSASTYNAAIDVNGQTLTINAFNTTIAGALDGSGAVVVAGAGLNLNSSGNFSGTIAGPLNVNGSNPNMNKSGPGLLAGNGTLGTVTAPSHLSHVMPGPQDTCCGDPHSVGTLHTKSLQVADSYDVDLVPGGTSDSLQVTGTVTLGGSLNVTILSGALVPGQQFTIIDNDASDPVVSTFTGLPEGALIGPGPYPLRISYHGGDGNDVVLTAVALTTTTLGQSSPSGIFGSSVTLTATVSSDFGAVPGSVAFYDGVTLLGTAPIQGGSASFTTSALGGGAHTLTASYGGGAAFAASTSAALSHDVQRGTATLSLTPSNLFLTFGDSLTLTASLTPVAPSTSSPTGSVTFQADGSALGPAAIVNFQAAFPTSTLAPGAHALTASYPGDTNYNSASTTAPVTVTVVKAATTLNVHALHNPSRADEVVVLQVTVGVVNPQAPISGLITVSENGPPLAQQAVTGSSSSLTVNGLATGVHHLTITFTGENFEPSSQTLVQTVLPPAISLAHASVVEGNSGTKVVPIAVHLSAKSSQPVSAQYHSQDGSAKAGEDYLAVDGTLTFAPGETDKNIDVTIVGDTTPEHDESFTIALSNPANAALEGSSATVTITNDDPWFRTTTFTYAPQRTLDVDTPIAGNGPFPAIVWVGGATTYAPGGDSPALRQTERGYVVVIPTYRSSEQAHFPAQLDDLKAAIAWIRANAATLNVDPLHIGIWGGGAGAQLASLVGVTGSGVQAVVDWGGPTDLLKLQSDAVASCVVSYDDASSAPSQLIGCALQTCPASANAASPLSSVTSDDAPILIIHGAADCVVPAEQSRRFFAALQAVHVDATLHIIDNLGAFGAAWDAAVSHAEVDAFLDAHLKGTTSKRRGVSH